MTDAKTARAREARSPHTSDAATAEVIARFGEDNLEAILQVYRAFADRVDYRALVNWSIKQPREDLLLPVFLRALVEITKTLDLGALREQLEGRADGDRPGWSWDWATRFTTDSGREYVHSAGGEETARELAKARVSNSGRWSLVRRAVGPWTEVER